MWIHDLPSLLTDEALATDAQIRAAVAATAGTTTTWLEYLVSTGALDEVAVVHASSRVAGVPVSDLHRLATVAPELQRLLPGDLAIEHRMIPLGLEADGDLCVAMADPFDLTGVREVEFFIGRGVVREIAAATPIAWALNAYYGARCALWPPHQGLTPPLGPRLARRSAPPPFTPEAAWCADLAASLADATSIVSPAAVPAVGDDDPPARVKRAAAVGPQRARA
jgi:hypothetical protein